MTGKNTHNPGCLSFVCLLLWFHLGDNTLASKWRGVVTQVIRLLHLGETINSTKCFKANILYFYYTIPCCLFVMLLIINVTPCVGVWIETKMVLQQQSYRMVTPCVGVWIETLCRYV